MLSKMKLNYILDIKYKYAIINNIYSYIYFRINQFLFFAKVSLADCPA